MSLKWTQSKLVWINWKWPICIIKWKIYKWKYQNSNFSLKTKWSLNTCSHSIPTYTYIHGSYVYGYNNWGAGIPSQSWYQSSGWCRFKCIHSEQNWTIRDVLLYLELVYRHCDNMFEYLYRPETRYVAHKQRCQKTPTEVQGYVTNKTNMYM